MNSKKSKSNSKLKRYLVILGYLLAATALAGLTVVLVAFGRGYSYDFRTHQVVRNGLLLLTSQPSDATITLGNKVLKHHTPYRLTLSSGSYDITVAKDGFRTWHKRLQMVASEVTFAQYILLLPQKLSVQTITPSAGSMTPVLSTDRKHLAYVADAAGDDLFVVSSDGTDQKQVWQVPTPTGDPSAAPGQIVSASWSADDSHLLVATQTASQTTEWVVAANGSGATDITASFKLTSGQLVFSPGNSQRLYWNSPDGLRELNLSDQTTSGVLATNVAQLSVVDGQLMYVEQGALGRSLMSLDGSNKKQQVVQILPLSDSYSIDAESFGGHSYVAVVPSQTHTATVYTDPLSDQPTSKIISQDASTVLFSPDGRYLLASEPSGGTVYDLDRTATTGKTVLYGLGTLGVSVQDFVWFDNYHLLYRTGGALAITEFDGGNATTLFPATGSPAWPLPNLKGFDVLLQKDGQSQLSRVMLRQ